MFPELPKRKEHPEVGLWTRAQRRPLQVTAAEDPAGAPAHLSLPETLPVNLPLQLQDHPNLPAQDVCFYSWAVNGTLVMKSAQWVDFSACWFSLLPPSDLRALRS